MLGILDPGSKAVSVESHLILDSVSVHNGELVALVIEHTLVVRTDYGCNAALRIVAENILIAIVVRHRVKTVCAIRIHI